MKTMRNLLATSLLILLLGTRVLGEDWAQIESSTVNHRPGDPLDENVLPDPEELAALRSQYAEAEKFRLGNDRPVDLASAARLYRAAVLWDEASDYSRPVGINFSEGAEPVKWFRKLAEQGDVNAQYLLSTCYHFGLTVPANLAEAFKWVKLAASNGDKHAQFWAGQFSQMGWGVKQSNIEAKKWWKLAAAQGHEHAQFKLDKMATRGD